LARFRSAGVKCVFVNVGDSDMTLQSEIALLASFRRYLKSRPNEYTLARNVADIEAAAAAGKLAVCFDLEGAHAIGTDLSLLELFYDLGVRWMLLVYNRRNQVGGGCHDDDDEGLTSFGREFLREMDRLGLIKDCSHCGYRTAREIIDCSDVPVNFSHSNPRALCDHPRNIPDELIRACAASGGVVGINGVGIFLGNDASSKTIVRHIDYVAQLVGPQHVAIALDCTFDKPDMNARLNADERMWPKRWGYGGTIGVAQPEQWPEIIALLLALGYSEADVSGIGGANFLRVARQVWKA
jgi:membrane dipeptidase